MTPVAESRLLKSISNHIFPSDLLMDTRKISIDLVIQVLLYTLLNPLFTWCFPLLHYLYYRQQESIWSWLKFCLYVTGFWILRYVNKRSKTCDFEFKEEINVLVTGGSSGLGLQVVKRLINGEILNKINKVYVIDLMEPDELRKLTSSTLRFVKCDLSEERGIEKAYQLIKDELNGSSIDLVVCNAGVRQYDSFLKLNFELIKNIFNINYFSHLKLIKLVLDDYLLERSNNRDSNVENKLHLISVTSVLGFISPKSLSIYSATKSSFMNLFDSLRYEVPDSVVLTSIVPGQLTSKMFQDIKVDNEFLAPLIDHVKLAQRITDIIDEGLNGSFVFPFYGRLIPLLRVLPWNLYRSLRKFSKMDNVT